MRNRLIEMKYFETYYLANQVCNIMSDPFGYLLDLNEWCGDESRSILAAPFPERSRLHDFVEFILMGTAREDASDIELVQKIRTGRTHQLWIDRAFRYHEIPFEGFGAWMRAHDVPTDGFIEDAIDDYVEDVLQGAEAERLFRQIADEVFHVLFSNRGFLLQFNRLASIFLGNLRIEDLENRDENDIARFMECDGVLKRAAVPAWARRAVFFRDRGTCVFCCRDVSGLLSLENELNVDHVVPLTEGGMNDITNLQLLCAECNSRKGGGAFAVPQLYERWY